MAFQEGNCKWTFAALQDNVLGQGAQNAIIAHFNKSPYTSLIREAIQNSLDVPANSDIPVKVEISFSRIQASEYPNFFELREHIKGIKESFPHNKKAIELADRMLEAFLTHMNNQRMPFIRVSDYNTTGMQYRPKGQGKSPFTSFLRIAGDSLKNNAGSGGSFGFGKAAYFYISPIRTVLVSTKTESGEVYFEGGTMLTDHKYNGVEKSFYGFYDDTEGCQPISEISRIPEKFRRFETGTDFFIMGVNATDTDREAAYKEMIEACLRNFWLAILHKKLEVKIGNVEINSENISDLIMQYFTNDRDDKNRSENYNPRPYFDAVKNAGLNSHYVTITQDIPVVGKVTLFIKKVKDAKDKVAYFRSPRMLVFSKQFQTSYGCYCVFFCDNPSGNELLRELENAAHKEWEPSNMEVNSALGRHAMLSIKEFISNSLESIFASDSDSPLGISGLEEFLYIEDDMLPSEDEEIKNNPFFGAITGEFTDEGTSMTSVLNPIQPKVHPNPQAKQGHVVAKKKTTAKSDSGGELGGNEKHPASNRKNEIPAPGNKPKLESDDGAEGTYHEFIPVRYKVIASSNPKGKMEHTIILYSPREIEDAMLELIVVCEQDTEILDIFDSQEGDFNGNQIFGLHLNKGRNDITFQFEDNMKHPVILKSYEYK